MANFGNQFAKMRSQMLYGYRLKLVPLVFFQYFDEVLSFTCTEDSTLYSISVAFLPHAACLSKSISEVNDLQRIPGIGEAELSTVAW